MQLYQSGFRPAQGYSRFEAEAEQAEQAATRQTQAMQQQRFQWEIDAKKDDRAKANMYQWFEGQSAKYDPNTLLEKMIGDEKYDIEGTRGFADEKKAEAFNAYKQTAMNPDIMWFEGQWEQRKQAEDLKIANELLSDYNMGKISEKEFNLATRDKKFQDWYRKSKLEDPTLGGIYKPAYETTEEFLFGREGAPGAAGKNIIERNPIKSAVAAISMPALGILGTGYQATKAAKKVAEGAVTKAEKIAKKYKGKYTPVGKFTKEQLAAGPGRWTATPGFKDWLTKNKLKPSKASFNKFSEEGYNILKNKADTGAKAAQDKMKLLEKKGLIKKVGGSWAKLPGFAKGIGLVAGMFVAEPVIRGVTGSKKAGEVGGAAVGAGLGVKFTMDQVKRNVITRLEKSGMKNIASNFSKIIDKKGWKWILQRAGTKAPGLLAKVAGKTAAGAIGGSVTGGVMTAAMAAWTVADLISLYNAITKED
jgi:hypothetical protein